MGKRFMLVGILGLGCVPELRIVHRDATAESAIDATSDASEVSVTSDGAGDELNVRDVVADSVPGDVVDAVTADAVLTEDVPLDRSASPDASVDTGTPPDVSVSSDSGAPFDVGASPDVGGPSDASDASTVIDAVAADAFVADVMADRPIDAGPATSPRPIAPLSGSVLGSNQPVLRWSAPAGVAEVELRVCADARCSSVRQTLRSSADFVRLDPLPRGVWYWRLRSVRGGAVDGESGPAWAFQVSGDATRTNLWSQLVDLDGDGRAEVVVGEPGYASGAGRVLGYSHPVGPTVAAPSWTIESPVGAASSFGAWVASAGDVNGDGFVDLVVGANGAAGRGAAYVFLGSSAGVSTRADVALSDPSSPSGFGWSAAGVGDVNGDGFGDVAVGAIGGAGDAGHVALFLGSMTGVRATAAVSLSPTGVSGAQFGISIAALGDIDDDGFSDFAVGAPRYGTSAGRVFLFHGRADVTRLPAPTILDAPTAGSFGLAVSNLGDLDNDGYAEFGVGAPGTPVSVTTWSGVGRVYVYRGTASGFGASPTSTLSIPEDGSAFGFSLSGGHDLDGDGRADFAVGAPYLREARGGVYVYQPISVTISAPSTTIPSDEGVGANAGFSVAMPGDVTGDGLADLVGSLPGSHAYAGRIVLFPGVMPAGMSVGAFQAIGADGSGALFGFSVAH